ncbi:hypothetical protein P22_0385 [Propionispora sp. 2/2-37]|uniref:alpha/beta hydrolase n=1 Tax=Propionispora sp. 2/2-37 TaxID=1677858 RepID=UPI0006BB7373|nr:alpha/beta fold hydrolase [Propionispora sp. 2/2-37]CUH94319.1 hypothetical protein P22_0385 [Propionispora sp. 2/2-37]
MIIKGAEAFLLPGGEHGVLVIHGFTGSPSEMKLLGEHLQTAGYTVLGPRLCGHGTRAEEMEKTEWNLWYGSVLDGYHLLQGICRKISVVGLSMGGLLALKLAAEQSVHKVASLCAPIYIAEKRLDLLPVYRAFRKYHPKKRRKLPGIDPVYSVAYDRTPLRSLASLLKLIKHVDGLLPQVTVPALIMQARNEHTVNPKSALHIYERIGSHSKELTWLDKSGHIITLDVEKEQVFKKVAGFLAKEG